MPENAPKKILNVDDNEAARYVSSRILRRAGFEVIEAATGTEALDMLAIQPDLVLLEVNLHDMSGFEVCRRIKSNPLTASIPVVHLSASYVRVEERVSGLEGGADGYLAQPVDPRELVATVNAFLRIREAEEKARSEAYYWQKTFDAISDAICVMGADARIVRANQAFAALAKLDPSEIIGRRCCELVHGVDKPLEGCPFFMSLKSRRRETLQAQINERWYHIVADPIISDTETTLGAVHIMTEISAWKKAQEERERMEAQLRQTQKMEALGTLAGGIAHDFNNILAIITGFIEIAQFKARPGTDLHSYLQEIAKAAARASDLVKQILTFSRKTDQQKQPLQLNLIVKEVMKLLRASLPSTITIRTQILSKALVQADPTQMHQVLMNLCTNAAQAMPDGGTLSVELTDTVVDAKSPPSPASLEPGRYIRLTVSDTGGGIDSAIIDRIFDPFFTTKKPGIGTGLGLSVVHGIVSDHRGAIEVRSTPGHGTTFEVLLPALLNEQRRVVEEERPIPTGCERLLVVDDEPRLAEALRNMLETLGYRVTVSTGSIEALETFRKNMKDNPFDLVATDLTMPQMTGIQLAGELLELQPDLPVILFSGHHDPVTVARAEAMGIGPLLLKPLTMHEIATAVREKLDRADSSTRLP